VNNQANISSYIHIRKNRVFLNDKLFYEGEQGQATGAFLKGLYKELKLDYAKYFKMDPLCKLGFLAVEVLLRHENADSKIDTDNLALVLSNSSSSLDTDLRYQETICNPENYFPSPALFVYTLPNIMIGEISIRHAITGESIFFVSPKFDHVTMHEHVTHLFEHQMAGNAVCGWIDVLKEDAEAVLFFVKNQEKSIESITFEPENLKKIFYQNDQ
jgi:hypothetical protein